jgi:hypothetical protein
MTPKYDVGDIVYSSFNKQNFMIVERLVPPFINSIPKYHLLVLDTGKFIYYYVADLDNNSCLVA